MGVKGFQAVQYYRSPMSDRGQILTVGLSACKGGSWG